MKNSKFILLTVFASFAVFFSSEFVSGLVFASYGSERPLAIIRRFKPDVSIKHAVRNNGAIDGVKNLEGITDIGFSVEEITQQ